MFSCAVFPGCQQRIEIEISFKLLCLGAPTSGDGGSSTMSVNGDNLESQHCVWGRVQIFPSVPSQLRSVPWWQ